MTTPSPHTLWTRSATAIVKGMLQKHRFLKTQDIWRMGTEGTRPTIQATQMIDAQGRIRMKRVSNIREGRRIWVPPPVTPLPHHPFQAMRFLKHNILGGLEAQNLVHKTVVKVPIRSAEGILEAERSAMRVYRRQVFEAKKAGLEPPTSVPEPRTHEREYYWTLGAPSEPRVIYEESDLSKPMTKEEVEAKTDELGWERAEQLEKAYHDAKALERELIDARKAVRKAKFLAERQQLKEERREMLEQGLGPKLAQEKRRAAAIESIENYARETGEDVSDWIKELEEAVLPSNRYPERVTEVVNPVRVDGKLRLTPGIPRQNTAKTLSSRK
ncbi:hypothetical protein CC85DRAFT_282006 [Cutaneotrichosporon oleaginosum]|uniref:Uncharacterized protein n=1 Tax=Cutaneotrichosporon oleaginosum TaxID=879819 RepID=A0A0J0XXQ8_9TREE|nr:uncharacterized protein CC85DRAFT_282006 [Cutaneotrichosporon oleaginosum]KLT45857.1 hypothetical protein CC85DRAFT_282006 [Cutaneotrichosporon oleaginosum]TXT06560.1 hypothetical protein COLE_05891 [Cutaneotrichosporon oleaginosum]